MGLCLLRIISFVVSEWKTTVSWLLLLHRTTLFWEEKMAFLLQTLQYSGYFRQSSWPCLGQSRFGLGLLKDLSALEKLRYWDSQERSFAPSKHSSLPRHSEPLCCLHCAPIVSHCHVHPGFAKSSLKGMKPRTTLGNRGKDTEEQKIRQRMEIWKKKSGS